MIPRLKSGDTVAIVAPSSCFQKEAFLAGVKVLENIGLKVTYSPSIFDKKYYLAGTDKRRAGELITALSDPTIKAVFCARGGYGLLRILPLIDEASDRFIPKIVVGYSDVTSLLLLLQQKLGWATYYGPVVAKDLSPDTPQAALDQMKKILFSFNSPTTLSFEETLVLKEGKASGPLTGGCLTLVCSSLGTKYEIDTRYRILFLEDINEKPYAVDRMLTQLKLAGKFQELQGMVLGSFENGGHLDDYVEVFEDVLSEYDFPILYNVPVGHGPVKMTLPLGMPVTLDTEKKVLVY